MKTIALISVVIGAACLLVTGCNKSEAALTPSGKGFEVEKPADQSVKQGASEMVKVAINRKGGFEGPVTVEVSGLPSGVTVDNGATQTIMAKDTALNLKLMASDSATVGDKNEVTVKVSAAADGQTLSQMNNFNLKVKSKN